MCHLSWQFSKKQCQLYGYRKGPTDSKTDWGLIGALTLKECTYQVDEGLGYGTDYKYAHDYKDNFVDEEFLPEESPWTSFYSYLG